MSTIPLAQMSDDAIRMRVFLCCLTAMDRKGKPRGEEWDAEANEAVAELKRRGLA